MACVRTFATFRVFAPTSSSDELSGLLGFRPTKATERNEHSPKPAERKFSFWSLSTKDVVGSTDAHEHVAWLLSRISELGDVLAELREQGGVTDVFCYFEMERQGGPSLTSSQMEVLSRLGLDIAWDIYTSDRSDD